MIGSSRHRRQLSVACLIAVAALVGSCSNDAESIEAQDQEQTTTPSTAAESEPDAEAEADPDAESEPPTTEVGQGPEAGVDHWHSAYLIHQCGTDLPAAEGHESPDGIHTHGDGLIHIHPFTPEAAGPNATLGKFVEELGGELTDDSYTRVYDEQSIMLSESDGCDGEAATLQLAFWQDANSEDPPVIITENIAGQQFTGEGSAYTLALLPAGAEIPKPPADRLAHLAQVLP